ncbi:MAG TPA: phosphate ABC transporter permease PstA [Actinomycetes bacterium]|nr:phosphate ABC transporter permease PstA [Actinomycetes bacterium]
MTTATTPPATTPVPLRLARGSLPRWAPWATLVAAAVVGAATMIRPGLHTAVAILLAIALHSLALGTWSRRVEGSRRAADRIVTTVVSSAFLLALVPLISVIVTVLQKGLLRFDAEFFTYSMRGIVGEGGGVYHAIVGTLIITGLAAAISIPVGLMSAVYLVEYGRGRLAKAVTFFVDVMTGIPSIVAGLFAYALFVLVFGPGVRMGFAGAIALSVLMVPVVVRATEEVLKIVPNELREASYALGVPKWRTVFKVVIPTAVAGIASGVTLAIARVIGETAPLLIVAGTTTSVILNPFEEGRMATLPVFAYYSYSVPGVPREPYLDRAWAAALTLILVVMALNLIGRVIAKLFAPKVR